MGEKFEAFTLFLAALNAAAIAYEWRTGKAMPPTRRAAGKVSGRAWDEHELDQRYPELVRALA